MRFNGISFPVTAYRGRLVALGVALCFGLAALGADTTNAVASLPLTAPATPSLLGPLVRMFGAVALVLGLLFGVQWWLRQNRRSGLGRNPANHLNVLEVKSLGHRHVLYVVGYEQQRLLVATSPAGVSLLTTLPEATVEAGTPPAPVVSFADALMQVVGRR